ncbi:MAG: hypothetical protein ACFBZ8_04370 [Opitutales bacterium]
MTELSGLQKLQTLNRLLSELAGSDPTVASDLDAVLRFLGRQSEFSNRLDGEWVAQKLLDFHAADWTLSGLRAIDFSDGWVDPLFFRARLIEAVQALQGYGQIVIVLSGLRRGLCPDGCRWSRARERQHQALLELAPEIVLRENFCGAPAHLVFL